mgnify:CR=1 FL=1
MGAGLLDLLIRGIAAPALGQQLPRPVLLLAVPGSGKTPVLVTRLGYMIYCKGIRPENILTVTRRLYSQ